MKTLIFNPFEKYTEKQLIVLGTIVTFLGSYIGYAFHFRFDGVLDAHIKVSESVVKVLIDNVINILCLSIFFTIASKIVNKKSRIIDSVSIVLISRIPMFLLPFMNIRNLIENQLNKLEISSGVPNIQALDNTGLIILFAMGIFSLAFLIWSIVLLYQGFKVSTNSKNKIYHTILFIAAILLAEVASKMAVNLWN